MPSSGPQQYPSLQTGLPPIERHRGRSDGAMAGDDQPVDDASLSLRSLPQGFPGTGRIHVYDVGAEKLPKPAQRHRLRNAVVMPEGVKRLGDHQSVTTTFSPAISARSILRRAISVCERGSPINRRSTTEVSSPMATGPSPGDAPTDVAQPMRLSLGVPAKGPDPGPVGSRPLQDPHGLLPDEPALHGDLRPGSEAELLAEGGGEGGLALGSDGHNMHAEGYRGSPYSATYPVRH